MNIAADSPTVVFVGAGNPFGYEIAQSLAKLGYRVCAIDDWQHAASANSAWISDPPSGVDVVWSEDGLKGTGLGSDSSIKALVVNSVSSQGNTAFLDVSSAEFEDAMQTGVLSAASWTQTMLPLLASGAQIVYLTTRGYLGAWGGVHRMAASAAVVALARSVALELADQSIVANVVATEFADGPEKIDKLAARVAHAVCNLVHADHGLVGHTLLIDGGRSLRMSESRRR